MSAGDRVLIRDPAHPWHGYSGWLGEKMKGGAAQFDLYTVELDNGISAGCMLKQLEKL